MKKLVILALFTFAGTPVIAVPVVPNFTQGSMTSHTETTSKVTETINSMDYATGWVYSVSGTNVKHDGASMTPGVTSETQTIDGVTSKWTGLNVNQKPNWTQNNVGQAFQFTETIQVLVCKTKQLFKG